MEPNTIVAPNLNGLMYRNHIPERNLCHSFLDFIDVTKEGHILLGLSNLNTRFWDGAVCYLKDFTKEFSLKQINTCLYLECGVTDGKLLKDDQKMIISHDSGDLNLLQISENKVQILEKFSNCEHEDRITEISLWLDSNCLITSCVDSSIRTWEITERNISSIHHYNDAHYNVVSSVSASPSDANIFASCSYDKTAMLWDKRKQDVAHVIYDNDFCALTKIQWHPSKSHVLIVATSSGDICLLDTREPDKLLARNSCYVRSIHNLRFNSNGLLGVCADDTKVKVFDTANEDLKMLYVDDRHNDFVRGLVWSNDTLISCGWDSKIYKHFV